MKKRCFYCKTIVKCDDTIIDEEKGYGIYCDVCGSFIKLTKQVNRKTRSNSLYNRSLAIRKKQKIKREIGMIITIIICFLLIIPIFDHYIAPSFVMQEQRTYSNFILLDNQTDEDVYIELSVLFPKNSSIFNDANDVKNLANFEIGIIAKASDIQIDIRNISYFWMQIDPLNKTKYHNDYLLFIGGINYQFCFYAYYKLPVVELGYRGV